MATTSTWRISWSSKKRTRPNRPPLATLILLRHNLQNNTEGARKNYCKFPAARLDQAASRLTLLGDNPGNAILSVAAGVIQSANREIGVPRFQTHISESTSGLRFIDFTFAPFRRPSLNPGRARAVWAVLWPLEAERPVSAQQFLAVFQIDAGDKSPRSLWPEAQISRQGSVAREAGASDQSADVAAVAVFVVAAADAAGFAAAQAVAAPVLLVAEIAVAVAPVVAVGSVVAAAGDAVGFAAEAAVVAPVALVVAAAVPARRSAGMTSFAAGRH